MDIQKNCLVCGATKSLAEFYKNTRAKDGHLNECKECHSNRMRTWRATKAANYKPAALTIKKVCPECRVNRPAQDFRPHKTRRDGLDFWCKDCVRVVRKKWRDEGGKEHLSDYNKRWYTTNAEKVKTRAKERHRRLRQQALEAYSKGIPKCACCGESEPKFLGIDHIDGGGAEHLRTIGASNVYYWTRARNYPPGFQVLCHNCNLAKGFYGQCPHQTNQKSFE